FQIVGPEFKRSLCGGGGVTVGMDRAGLLCGGQQGQPGAIRLLRRQPVLSDGQRCRALGLEALSHLAMEGAATYPGDIAIDRFAGERVPESTMSRLALYQ